MNATASAAIPVAAPEPGAGLIKRLMSDDAAVWRPACDELVARIWPRSSQHQHALEPVTVARETALGPRNPGPVSSAPPKPRTGGPDRCDGRCVGCRAPLAVPARGPRAVFCSDRCRKRATRTRLAGQAQAVPAAAWRWPA